MELWWGILIGVGAVALVHIARIAVKIVKMAKRGEILG